MIIRSKDMCVDAQTISGCLEEFMREVRPRLMRLYDAYEGKGAITRRIRGQGLPNNRLSHAFPRYITTMAAGYLTGRPIQYGGDQEEGVQMLRRLYGACDVDSVDAELARDASICGKGICIVYADEMARPRAATLDPRQAFVVYDDTVEHRAMLGVHFYARRGETGRPEGMHIYAYTPDACLHWTSRANAGPSGEPEWTPSFFDSVPMVEFWNNADERGDFEPVLSLIEAYDQLESDRMNDKQQFTDAILLLTGCVLENDDPDDARTPAQKLIEEKTLSLPDSDAKAQWLVKQSDEAGTEIFKNALRADIHKMSMVPDLTDEQFAYNSSGVAMRYKLLGLEQLTADKERWFREGLRCRLRLFARYMQLTSMAQLDPERVTMTFTRSLPVNESEAAQTVALLHGIVPDEVLFTQLPFMEDAMKLRGIKGEKEEAD